MNNNQEFKQILISMFLWLTLFIILLVSFSSCTMPVKKFIVEEKVLDNSTRSHKYIECISRLGKEGIKQSFIERLCNQALGGIE